MENSNNNILPFSIGIQSKDSGTDSNDREPIKADDFESRLILPKVEPLRLLDASGKPVNAPTWDKYIAWRKTKCRPFDYANLAKLGTKPIGSPADYGPEDYFNRTRAQEEIDQAILELIGETAELAELIYEHGPMVFFGSLRDKLIDECGDILFCANWALDAWGFNPLAGAEELEIIAVSAGGPIDQLSEAIRLTTAHAAAGDAKDGGLSEIVQYFAFNWLVPIQFEAGLLANSFKKLRYQRREQDVDKQLNRIGTVLLIVNTILYVAGSSIEAAILVNMRKLDARFPDGYKPGVGGGVRTGDGA